MKTSRPHLLFAAILSLGLFAAAAVARPMPVSAPDKSVDLSLGSSAAWASTLAPSIFFQGENGGGDDGDELSGPYFLRSATPVSPGEAELKFIYGYNKHSGGGDDNEIEFVFEWGIAEDWELIIESSWTIFEGQADGNGDIDEIGFHIRHWKEGDCLPAFATRHLISLPTGHNSDGVDYTLRGLFSWTLQPGKLNLHLNPYMIFNNGQDDDERAVQWGVAIGTECTPRENLKYILSYHIRPGEEEGFRNQHSLEFGVDWEFAEDRILAFGLEWGIDGDDQGDDISARVSYIYEFGLARLDR